MDVALIGMPVVSVRWAFEVVKVGLIFPTNLRLLLCKFKKTDRTLAALKAMDGTRLINVGI